ncbi:zinc finger protein 510-like [Myzus persicae]|uniref:zinc finger protein 510-like n=1 Tax=Myzus persicae TaxID=13164 RepID=UPI000B939262|nr:zinc finger protein 510-like [Myzus persicae]
MEEEIIDDQVLNGIIKEEIIEDTDHVSDGQLFQIGSGVMPFQPNLMYGDQELHGNVEEDIIDDQVFNGNIQEEIIEDTDHNSGGQLFLLGTIVELVKVNFIDGSEIKGTVSNDSKSSGLLARMKTSNCLRENTLIHNCNKNISTTSNVTVTKKHNTKKEHKCNVCDKLFPYRSILIRHSRTHTGEKPYACAICFKPFGYKSNLRLHTRRHTGEKPYACAICFKPFSRKSNLRRHTRIHTGEKPYQCDICYKKFTNGSNLRRHTRKHSGEDMLYL